MKKKILVTAIALLALVALLVVGIGCTKKTVKVYVSGHHIGVDITNDAANSTVTVKISGGNLAPREKSSKIANRGGGVGFDVAPTKDNSAYTIKVEKENFTKTVYVNP